MGLLVFSVRGPLPAWWASTRPTTPRATLAASAEELFKKGAETGKPKIVGDTAKIEPHILVPGRWCATTLLSSFPGCPIAVVPGTLLGVLEDFIGLAKFLELLLGAFGLVHIRVILARQFAVGTLDLSLRGLLANAKDGIVILKLHPMSPQARPVRLLCSPPHYPLRHRRGYPGDMFSS